MKTVNFFIILAAIFALQSCKLENSTPASNVPNGDFEGWTSLDNLDDWTTNSCPTCVPPYETYIVQKTTEAYHGQYAAKFIYNGVYPAYANSTFAVTAHPSNLTGYVKCYLYNSDTVSVKVWVFKANAVVDSGQWLNTESISSYKQIVIPVTQSSTQADSVKISIKGGHKMDAGNNGSVLWVDYLSLR
jgi:hypothetical protein